MAAGHRKQITFDLQQAALRKHYPRKPLTLNPQYYKKAYRDIQEFMIRNGFEHRQYSVYTSVEKMTVVDVVRLIGELGSRFPWLFQCVNEIDVTDIGAQHSLKQILEGVTMAQELEAGAPGVLQGTKNEHEP